MDSHLRRHYSSSYKLICHKVILGTSHTSFQPSFHGNHMGDTVTFWPSSSETSVLFQGSHCRFCSMQSATGRGVHKELNFLLLITIPPLLSSHLSVPDLWLAQTAIKLLYSLSQLGLYLWPSTWLQSQEKTVETNKIYRFVMMVY
jgi:hypothetical protein